MFGGAIYADIFVAEIIIYLNRTKTEEQILTLSRLLRMPWARSKNSIVV